MHMLGKVVGVVEVDETLLVSLDDLGVQQQAGSQVFGDLTGHIVALYAVHGGVIVGVLLLDLDVYKRQGRLWREGEVFHSAKGSLFEGAGTA